MLENQFIKVFLFVLMGLLVGCQEQAPAPTEVVQFPLRVETIPTETPTVTPTVTFTVTPSHTLTPTPNLSPTSLPTEVALVGCAPPDGWITHTVQAGETLFAFQLGSGGTVTVDDIIAANCMTERWIYEGQRLFLPPGAAENAPSSETAPTPFSGQTGGVRTPNCPCEITIRAGWRLEQIAEVIDSLPVGFYGRDFLAAARSFPPRDFMNGMPPASSLEGYMLPGTYTITNEMTAADFREMVLETFGAAAAPLLNEAANVGLNPYQVVTLASIIVRESGSYEQQILISSVFHNRLKSGRGLGATVTTEYALGHSGDWWPNAAGYVSTYDSPYNTNLYTGLPPSPISSPSVEAIRAAVSPATTNYLFFTANCNGPGNVYAETYEQHLANVNCE